MMRRSYTFTLTIILVLLAVIVAMFIVVSTPMDQQYYSVCEVRAKDLIYTGRADGERTKVVTTTCGTFGVNSYMVWEQLEVGKVYDLKAEGYGLSSASPRIMEVTLR